MKTCDYCGWENGDAMASCSGCGKSLIAADPEIEGAPTADSFQPKLRAGTATKIWLLSGVVQFFFGLIIVAWALSSEISKGIQPADLLRRIQSASPLMMLSSTIVGGVTMVLMARRNFKESLRDTSSTGAAWVVGSPGNILLGLGAGATCSVFSLGVAWLYNSLWPIEPGHSMGPISRMASTPGITRLFWIVLVLLCAPPFEELLWRGVMYGGYRRSFGPVRAALLTTGIFVSLHFLEMIHFWPSIVGITGFALTALWIRLRSAAIGPAIAAHFAYNSVVVILVLCS